MPKAYITLTREEALRDRRCVPYLKRIRELEGSKRSVDLLNLQNERALLEIMLFEIQNADRLRTERARPRKRHSRY